MSQRDDRITLRQMCEHAQEALSLVTERSDEQILEDRVLCFALRSFMEIVGEAAGRVSTQTRSQYPEVPWRLAINTRNRISHGYDTLDMRVILKTIRDDLPSLITRLEQILATDFPHVPPPDCR